MEAGLEGVTYYDPPNMTCPFGAYAVAVELTGAPASGRSSGWWRWRLRGSDQPDDCRGPGHRRAHRGVPHGRHGADHLDELGDRIGSSFSDYLSPTSWETPKFDSARPPLPRPTTRSGPRRWGSRPPSLSGGCVNAVVDALAHAGVRELEMPMGPDKVWKAMAEAGLAE